MITEFGNILRRHRQKRQILLGELARAVNIGSAELSSYESGRLIMPDLLIKKISSLLLLKDIERDELLLADKTNPIKNIKNRDSLSIAIMDLTRST